MEDRKKVQAPSGSSYPARYISLDNIVGPGEDAARAKADLDAVIQCTAYRLKTLFDHSNDALFVVRKLDHRVWKTNREATKLLSLPYKSLIHRPIQEIFPDFPFHAHLPDNLNRNLDYTKSIQVFYINALGESKQALIKVLPLHFPKEELYLIIAQDKLPDATLTGGGQSNGTDEAFRHKGRSHKDKATAYKMVTTTYNADFKDSLDSACKVAVTDATVLLLGETGTGKELMAEFIHQNSAREEKPLIRINCAALPENLIESELFGHEKGAFTGAVEQRIGRFEMAHCGTILLDEIGDLPGNLQIKLLRVLQERVIERIGGKKPVPVDVRVIAATNQNLSRLISRGLFRSDLYYRLNVFPITLPPLRERLEDIEHLAKYFIVKHRKNSGSPAETITASSLARMREHPWQGNIRELENIIERCLILSTGHTLEVPKDVLIEPDPEPESSAEDGDRHMSSTSKPLKEIEMDAIQKAVRNSNGIIEGRRGAARQLGIPPSTLRDRMREFGISKP